MNFVKKKSTPIRLLLYSVSPLPVEILSELIFFFISPFSLKLRWIVLLLFFYHFFVSAFVDSHRRCLSPSLLISATFYSHLVPARIPFGATLLLIAHCYCMQSWWMPEKYYFLFPLFYFFFFAGLLLFIYFLSHEERWTSVSRGGSQWVSTVYINNSSLLSSLPRLLSAVAVLLIDGWKESTDNDGKR